jgi:hypothetical protein
MKPNNSGFILQSFASLNVESVKQLCDRLGSSEILFRHLANYAIECYKKLTSKQVLVAAESTTGSSVPIDESAVVKTNLLKAVRMSSWGGLLIVTLLRLHEGNSQNVYYVIFIKFHFVN